MPLRFLVSFLIVGAILAAIVIGIAVLRDDDSTDALIPASPVTVPLY